MYIHEYTHAVDARVYARTLHVYIHVYINACVPTRTTKLPHTCTRMPPLVVG